MCSRRVHELHLRHSWHIEWHPHWREKPSWCRHLLLLHRLERHHGPTFGQGQPLRQLIAACLKDVLLLSRQQIRHSRHDWPQWKVHLWQALSLSWLLRLTGCLTSHPDPSQLSLHIAQGLELAHGSLQRIDFSLYLSFSGIELILHGASNMSVRPLDSPSHAIPSDAKAVLLGPIGVLSWCWCWCGIQVRELLL